MSTASEISDVAIIAIEGLDGSGKSYLCERLRRHFSNSSHVGIGSTPSRKMKNIALSLLGNNQLASYLAFMVGNSSITIDFPENKIIVLDRYILSTIVHHFEQFVYLRDNFFGLIDSLHILPASLTVLLDVSPELAAERIAKRRCDPPLLVPLVTQRKRYAKILEGSEGLQMSGEVLIERNHNFADLDRIEETIVVWVRNALSRM